MYSNRDSACAPISIKIKQSKISGARIHNMTGSSKIFLVMRVIPPPSKMKSAKVQLQNPCEALWEVLELSE
jgi:hypothetical protein